MMPMIKPKIICVTGNTGKRRIFENTIGDLLDLEMRDVDAPEIQSMDVEEVARTSALWAAREVDAPVLKTDIAYYIHALKGFPGPFVKWMNKTLGAENILKMMEGVTDRRVRLSNALAYATPDGYAHVVRIDRDIEMLHDIIETPWESIFDKVTYADPEKTFRFAEKSFDEQIEYLSNYYRDGYRRMAQHIIERWHE